MRALLVTLLLPAVFAPGAGWHTGHGHVHACSGVPASRCVQATSWAATIAWRGCRDCIPHQVIERLPGDGVILQVTVSVEHPIAAGRALSWPPTIHPREVAAGFEGVPARYGVYQTSARFGGVEAYVWAFFGRRHPTRAQLASANAELRTAAAQQRPLKLERGEIVLFTAPRLARTACGVRGQMMARLIGRPGDRWAERNGLIFIDGKRLREPYLHGGQQDRRTLTLADIPPRHTYTRIPAGMYLVMGDARAIACDSRRWGLLPAAAITGIVRAHR